MNIWRCVSARGKVILWPLNEDFYILTVLNISWSAPWPKVTKFHVEPLLLSEHICPNVSGHIGNITTMPIYAKTFKNILLQSALTNGFETWYVASGTKGLPRLLKWWLCVDLDLFYDNIKYAEDARTNYLIENVRKFNLRVVICTCLNDCMMIFTIKRSKTIFIHLLKSHWLNWGTKNYSNSPVHINKMTAMPIYD